MGDEIQPTTPHTDGIEDLAAWMAADPKVRTRAWVGRKVGTSGQCVSQWFALKSRPSARIRPRIRALAGIPEARWLTPDERAAEAAALAAAGPG